MSHGLRNAITFQEKVDRAHVEVSYRGKAGHLSGVGDRATDEFIAGAVRAAALTALHPRTAVHVSGTDRDRSLYDRDFNRKWG